MMFDTQDTRTLLGPADPARGVVVPLPRVSAADLIARQEPTGAAPAHPKRRVVLAGAAVTVAAGAAGAAVYPLLRSTKERSISPGATDGGLVVPIAYQITTDPPPAGKYLRELSRRIDNAPLDIHRGRYAYHRTRRWGGMWAVTVGGYVIGFADKYETWAAADGSTWERQTTLAPEYPDEAARRHYESFGRQSPPQSDGKLEKRRLAPGVVEAPRPPLPTHRAQLTKLLDVQYGSSAAAQKICTLFEDYLIPHATRALMLDILADVPGWFWRGEVTDRAGRPGVAITGEDHGQQQLLVFDPKTGVLLAHEVVFLLQPERRVASYQLLLVMDRTDRLG